MVREHETIFQPAHSPELNPIERLWSDLKKHFKGNNFDNLAALRKRAFDLINSLCPATIMSLAGWSYILDALDKVVINIPLLSLSEYNE